MCSSQSLTWKVAVRRCSGQTEYLTFPTKEAAEADIKAHNYGQLISPDLFASSSGCGVTIQGCETPSVWTVVVRRCDGTTQSLTFPTREAAEADIKAHNYGELVPPTVQKDVYSGCGVTVTAC